MKKFIICRLTPFFLIPLLALSAYAAEQTIDSQKTSQWRTVSPENTLYMDTASGRIIFELAPQFSPNHVKHIKQLVRAGFYDGLTFYRVIEQFVVQGGDPTENNPNRLSKKTLQAEFEWPIDPKRAFTLVQSPDMLAGQTGFVDGFAVGRDLNSNREWLVHCPGVVNLARDTPTDSGTTDFAIMMGQSPRHLDRNMSIFGRIIHGSEHLNHIKRGDRAKGGMIDTPAQRSKIIKMTIAADLPKQQQMLIKVENTHSQQFKQKLTNVRKRKHPFFIKKGNNALDICYVNIKTDFPKHEM